MPAGIHNKMQIKLINECIFVVIMHNKYMRRTHNYTSHTLK